MIDQQRGTLAQDMDDAVDQTGSQLFMTDDQNADHFVIYLFVC